MSVAPEKQERGDLPPEAVKSSRNKMLVLFAIAFFPIFIAYAAFFFVPQWIPSGTTNQGELIQPPINGGDISQTLTAYDTWVLVQPVSSVCDEDCAQMLYLSRQVVKGLGKDSERVMRVIVSEAPLSQDFRALIDEEHSDVGMIRADTSLLSGDSRTTPALFLMDPNANIMMVYGLDEAGKPMMKDLKHLLRVSNIG